MRDWNGQGRASRRALLAGIAGAALVAPAQPIRAQGSGPGHWPTKGWRAADPADHGVDAFALEAVTSRATEEVPAISALLAVRHGYLVYEEYFAGLEPDTPINVRSVTKSVTGTLAGVALQSGLLTGLEQTVGEVIPERMPEAFDPLTAEVTLWQWLTMTSALQWDAHGDWQRLLEAPDWVAMTLGLPVVDVPGVTYVYNTGGSHVLGVMVAKAAGEPLEAYADEVLFRPLGIAPGDWMRR
jgi:CubicO group peptidase (beta-lactamase class C family)